MDKKLFVIAIAVGTMVITMLQIFMQGRELNPKVKLLVWGALLAGVAALIAISIRIPGR